MEQVARRYITAAAAVTAAAGLIAAIPALTPSLPDVQVRGTDLTANVSDLPGSEVTALYDVIQQEFSGNTDAVQNAIAPGEVFSGDDGIAFGGGDPSLTADDTTVDPSLVTGLLGGSFDPAVISAGPLVGVEPGVNAVGGGTSGGLFGGTDALTSAAVSFIALSAADLVPALQAAYQGFTSAVVAAEMAYNDALVNTQVDTVERFFGSGNTASDFISWIFSNNNMLLAQNETALNNLIGANFDPDAIHGSLVTALNAQGFTLDDWAVLLGVSPDELSQVVSAAQSSDLWTLLDGFGLAGIFPGLF
jgi:hypothetical protein